VRSSLERSIAEEGSGPPHLGQQMPLVLARPRGGRALVNRAASVSAYRLGFLTRLWERVVNPSLFANRMWLRGGLLADLSVIEGDAKRLRRRFCRFNT